ncbi:MAG: FAD:protein FMN transferase [Microthrixaceae bacterium]
MSPGSTAGREEILVPSMGSRAHILLDGAAEGIAAALQDRLVELESRWSRFREDSELSVLNRSQGRPTVVSADTAALIERMLWSWERTGGLYDPTVLEAISRKPGTTATSPPCRPRRHPPRPAGPCAPTPRARTSPAAGASGSTRPRLVQLPPGTGIDPGGIGRAWRPTWWLRWPPRRGRPV